jgi:7-cyano-7-deazaguanine reductase
MNEINQIHLLDHFNNPEKKNEYLINIKVPEFTCLCPKTGQPDFAILYINYIPDKLCIELKSLKLYIVSFRQIGTFHEAVTMYSLRDFAQTQSLSGI